MTVFQEVTGEEEAVMRNIIILKYEANMGQDAAGKGVWEFESLTPCSKYASTLMCDLPDREMSN